MDSRSAEDRTAGILRIAVGSEERIVPTLPMRASREWQAQIGKGTAGFTVPVSDADWTAAAVADFSGLSMDAILDVVVSYDRTNALGGRDWLEEHADPSQLYAAAILMTEVAAPFWPNVPMLLAALVVRSVVASNPPSSTNGHSRTGALTHGRSKTASTRRS